jgi:hypothetical protein
MLHRSLRTSLAVAIVGCLCLASTVAAQPPPAGLDATAPSFLAQAGSATELTTAAAGGGGGGVTNVLTVNSKGGKFKTIGAALDSIKDASSTNRYLVQVGPGDYVERVVMKSYVDIAGSGRRATKITAPGAATPEGAAVVRTASYAQLRSLSVSNTGLGAEAVGVYSPSGQSMDLLDVQVTAGGGTVETWAVYAQGGYGTIDLSTVVATPTGGAANAGIRSVGYNLKVDRSTVIVSAGPAVYKTTSGLVEINQSVLQGNVGMALSGGCGVQVFGSRIYSSAVGIQCADCAGNAMQSVVVAGSTAPSRAVEVTKGSFEILGSELFSDSAGLFVDRGASAKVMHTHFDGGGATGAGTVRCTASTTAAPTFLADSCP